MVITYSRAWINRLRLPNLLVVSFFFLLFFFHLTYSRWTSSLPSCLWSQRIFPSLPGSCLTFFLSRCKFSTLTTRQPMVEFYLLTFPRFPLRKKEHESYFGKNRTHDFRTSRCAGYLLDHSGDEQGKLIFPCPRTRLRIWSGETGSTVPSPISLLIVSIFRLNLVHTYGIPPQFRGGVHFFLSNRHTLSGQSRVYRVTQIPYRWRSLPRVRRHRASKPQGSYERVLPWQVTMDQLICASFSHTYCVHARDTSTVMLLLSSQAPCFFLLTPEDKLGVCVCVFNKLLLRAFRLQMPWRFFSGVTFVLFCFVFCLYAFVEAAALR